MIGRFISADSFATTDIEGFLSCNMFAYCENDPVSLEDPLGQNAFKNGVKWFLKKVVDPAVQKLKEHLASKQPGTSMIGYCGSGAFLGHVAGARGIAVDNQGNIAFIESYAYGGGIPNASIGLFVNATNAPSVKMLYGQAAQVGGGVGPVGADVQFFRNPTTGERYTGMTVTASIPLDPIPAEFHGDVCMSRGFSINIFDIWDNAYQAVMDW